MNLPPESRLSADDKNLPDIGLLGDSLHSQALIESLEPNSPRESSQDSTPLTLANLKTCSPLPDPSTTLHADLSSSVPPHDLDGGQDTPRASGSHQLLQANGHNAPRSASGAAKICKKCQEPLTGQFVRALGGTFHLSCFKCRDCGQIVASKFFPADDEGVGQYPLCETDYFKRLDLLCSDCGGALRGSYITALERKYHIEHFTCSVCPTIFGAQDSYYEHEGKVYCHFHYSTQFAQRCNGCHAAILKQFVEIFRNGQDQHWHPECYMIHKFWNVRLSPPESIAERPKLDSNATDEERDLVRNEEEKMEGKVYQIWSVLSTFEESSAACISDMLLHVSNGAYIDGVLVAKKFILHVQILFKSTDRLDSLMNAESVKGLSYAREAKLLCKKIVAFFSLLSKTQDTGVRKLGVTQELLSLVTGLAHYLKLLIRITLQGALRLEREILITDGLRHFLEDLGDLDGVKEPENPLEFTPISPSLADRSSDLCSTCKSAIEDECARYKDLRWHIACLTCSNCVRDLGHNLQNTFINESENIILCFNCAAQHSEFAGGLEHVTKLQQYVFLLQVALARLLAMLRAGNSLPHTSDDPNLEHYDSNDGHRVPQPGELLTQMPRSNTRSKSYGLVEEQGESTYAQTLGDIRRLRSTRMDKHLSTTIKKARTSRIIDGPESSSVRPGSAGIDGSNPKNLGFQIIEDRDVNGDTVTELTFGNQDSLTLDDIPRIVAAEQAKEQRPNAYKHSRNQLYGSQSSSTQPKLFNGYRHDISGDHEQEQASSPQRPKRFFSELTALDYFIVRHVAVLSMEPLLEGHFNLEELLGLIEIRKPTFWGKFGKVFKNDGSKGGKKKGVFGVGLDVLVERDGAESTLGVGPGALKIPALIDDCVSAMRQMDMSVEGVFRKNGNIRRLNELAEAIDIKGVESVDLTKENPVQVAALLKKFLRELPDPVLTFKLHHLFITSQKIKDEAKRRRVLHLTCCLLPKAHRDCMEILFSFLNWASSFSHIDEESGSKMDVHNLATVITPNILKTNSKAVGVDDSFLGIEAVHLLIEANDTMCEVPEDLQSILNDTTLFDGSADITTKGILKRYADIARNPGPHRTVMATNSPPAKSRDSRNNTPLATRIDTDPSQATAWQKESSVRHVQGPTGQSTPYIVSSTHNTPSQNTFDFSNPNSPYHRRAASAESQLSQGLPHRPYRNSGWGGKQSERPSQSPGQLGITGSI
ncbi:MAG: hypothetical protein M1829_000725 [Trizodia sp. TS-e1964]|nr:MAG: hypothetical protein M1829_000725 [Trizodia sp. TS-e1964]